METIIDIVSYYLCLLTENDESSILNISSFIEIWKIMSSQVSLSVINILLVEDNPGDIRLTEEVLKEGKIKNNLSVTTDGEEAINFLKKLGKHENAITPDIILLDLNLPKKDGREVLAEIKSDPKLRAIPVVVLTTSDAEADIAKMYAQHANCYITKPVDFNQFILVIQSIENFWLTVVKLPKVKF